MQSEQSGPVRDFLLHRHEKLARWREAGFDPYPYGFRISHRTGDLRERFEELSARGETVTGDIVKETSQEVQINVGGRPQRISRREIAPDGITYDGEPRQLTEGRTALAAGDYAAAHQHFQSVIGALEAAGGGDSAKDTKNEKNGKAKQKVRVSLTGLDKGNAS